MGRIYTGTCSWAEKTLIMSGEFYPEGSGSSEGRLRYYASRFETVEVDSTYYAIPPVRTAGLWAERTPPGFIFHIKVYGALTGHAVSPRTLPPELRGLLPARDAGRESIFIREPSLLRAIADAMAGSFRPLKDAGKLGHLVFQFPPWFMYSAGNLDYIISCREMAGDARVAVEFRHGSWLAGARVGDVLEFLRLNDITYVTADEPQYGDTSTVPFLPEATTDTAYVRLHGRNSANWLKKGIETSLRYDYFYSDGELSEFAESVMALSRKAEQTFVMFNNCHGGFAVKNALAIKELLRAR